MNIVITTLQVWSKNVIQPHA